MHHNGGSAGGRDGLGDPWLPFEGNRQRDEIDLSPRGQLAALPQDREPWYADIMRNRKWRIFMAILWAYFVAHGTYLIVNFLFFSHH
jgi:hypothetical protein